MSQAGVEHMITTINREENEDALIEDEDNDQEGRSEGGDDINENELDTVRRELIAEVNELEWEFKQAKEKLYNERISQVDAKLAQAKSAIAPEFIDVAALVEEAYRIRRQVAKYRRDFALEEANKEIDSQLLAAKHDASDKLYTAEDRIRSRLQEELCECKIVKAMKEFRWRQEHGMRSYPANRRSRQRIKREQKVKRHTRQQQQQQALGSDGGGGGHRELSPISSVATVSRSSSHSSCSRSSISSSLDDDADYADVGVENGDTNNEECDASDRKFDDNSSAVTASSGNGASREGVDGETKAVASNRKGTTTTTRRALNSYRIPLPSPDLLARKKPVSMVESAPCIIYQLSEQAIQADVAMITQAIRERKLNRALTKLKNKRRPT